MKAAHHRLIESTKDLAAARAPIRLSLDPAGAPVHPRGKDAKVLLPGPWLAQPKRRVPGLGISST